MKSSRESAARGTGVQGSIWAIVQEKRGYSRARGWRSGGRPGLSRSSGEGRSRRRWQRQCRTRKRLTRSIEIVRGEAGHIHAVVQLTRSRCSQFYIDGIQRCIVLETGGSIARCQPGLELYSGASVSFLGTRLHFLLLCVVLFVLMLNSSGYFPWGRGEQSNEAVWTHKSLCTIRQPK
jgi:hypothetical protein